MSAVGQAEHDNLKTLIVETVTLLCRNGLKFKRNFCVEGLLGITLDENQVFLVNIKETVRNALESAAAQEQQLADDSQQPTERRDTEQSDTSHGSDTANDTNAAARRRKRRRQQQRARHRQDVSPHSPAKRAAYDAAAVKQENDDVIVVKEERDVTPSDGQYANDAAYPYTGDAYEHAGAYTGGAPRGSSSSTSTPYRADRGFYTGEDSQAADVSSLLDATGGSESAAWEAQQYDDSSQLDLSGSQAASGDMQVSRLRNVYRSKHARAYRRSSLRFKCPTCERAYSAPASLRRHIRTNHESGGFRHSCQYCSKTFLHRFHLHEHVYQKHQTKYAAYAAEYLRQHGSYTVPNDRVKASRSEHVALASDTSLLDISESQVLEGALHNYTASSESISAVTNAIKLAQEDSHEQIGSTLGTLESLEIQLQ